MQASRIFKDTVKSLSHRLGYDIASLSHTRDRFAREKFIFDSFEVDAVLDVGANEGQFGEGLRRNYGYRGKVVSFEPIAEVFSRLKMKADEDGNWQALNYALGNTPGTLEINVSGNTVSSSFLSMNSLHEKAAPESVYVRKEAVSVKRLDDVSEKLCAGARNILLKIDTQGFERRVLAGAAKSLARIDTVLLEMSMASMYVGEETFVEHAAYMRDLGYRMVAFESFFFDSATGYLLSGDGWFHRIR